MQTLLFQGDSITDCSRDKNDPFSLGTGYPMYASKRLPNLKVLNRGISGNRVCDLVARWDGDCLALRPDVVSIMIGINNTWRRYDRNDPTSDADFDADYRRILAPLVERNIKILLIQPFLLDISPAVSAMREDLAGKQAVVLRMSGEFNAALLDADDLFLRAVAAQGVSPSYFSADGIHPTPEGHILLGKAVAKEILSF